VVPIASSYASKEFAGVDDGDAGEAEGRIDASSSPAGGRKVAGSNPVAPTNSHLAYFDSQSRRESAGRIDGFLDLFQDTLGIVEIDVVASRQNDL
jgi:hypothetical protein